MGSLHHSMYVLTGMCMPHDLPSFRRLISPLPLYNVNDRYLRDAGRSRPEAVSEEAGPSLTQLPEKQSLLSREVIRVSRVKGHAEYSISWLILHSEFGPLISQGGFDEPHFKCWSVLCDSTGIETDLTQKDRVFAGHIWKSKITRHLIAVV